MVTEDFPDVLGERELFGVRGGFDGVVEGLWYPDEDDGSGIRHGDSVVLSTSRVYQPKG